MEVNLRVGIVEDHDDLREALVELLKGAGHAVIGFPSAEALDEAPGVYAFDLLVLDLNLPGEDGLTLAARLKRVQPSLRVIMMTTRNALIDRVRGYDVGADLYLPKPVAENEILAAVRALARQIRAGVRHDDKDTPPPLLLDSKALHLRGPEVVVPLSHVEAVLLSALARAPGQRLEYWQLIEVAGLDTDEAGKANLAVRVTRLRAKLARLGCPGSALTAVRATGYQLCVPLHIG